MQKGTKRKLAGNMIQNLKILWTNHIWQKVFFCSFGRRNIFSVTDLKMIKISNSDSEMATPLNI